MNSLPLSHWMRCGTTPRAALIRSITATTSMPFRFCPTSISAPFFLRKLGTSPSFAGLVPQFLLESLARAVNTYRRQHEKLLDQHSTTEARYPYGVHRQTHLLRQDRVSFVG